jgi:hypothetical protein
VVRDNVKGYQQGLNADMVWYDRVPNNAWGYDQVARTGATRLRERRPDTLCFPGGAALTGRTRSRQLITLYFLPTE